MRNIKVIVNLNHLHELYRNGLENTCAFAFAYNRTILPQCEVRARDREQNDTHAALRLEIKIEVEIKAQPRNQS